MKRTTIAAAASAAALLLLGCATPVPTVDDALTPGIFLDDGGRDVLPAGVALRPVFPKGLGTTKVAEGFRGRLYNDVAHYCTIGYGHLLKRAPCDGSEAPPFLAGLSEPAASDLLVGDMAAAQRTVMVAVDAPLSDAQYAALCDFVFNVGSTNFRSSALLRVVNAREFDKVPFQLRRWVMAGGREIDGLKARRTREIDLFFDGQPVPRAAQAAGEDASKLDIRTGR